MPIPWLVVLQSVPWTEVIRNAPKVADGARKLWQAMRSKASGNTAAAAVPLREALTNAQLHEHMLQMQSSIFNLQAELLESSGLIKSLAEQNIELVRRIDTQSRRLFWLTLASGLCGALAVVGLLLPIAH